MRARRQTKRKEPFQMKAYSFSWFYRIVCVTASLVALTQQSASGQAVEIPDADLRAAIWTTLGKALPSGILTVTDMLSLTNLNLGLTSLPGTTPPGTTGTTHASCGMSKACQDWEKRTT